jgi:hypothetical protein
MAHDTVIKLRKLLLIDWIQGKRDRNWHGKSQKYGIRKIKKESLNFPLPNLLLYSTGFPHFSDQVPVPQKRAHRRRRIGQKDMGQKHPNAEYDNRLNSPFPKSFPLLQPVSPIFLTAIFLTTSPVLNPLF